MTELVLWAADNQAAIIAVTAVLGAAVTAALTYARARRESDRADRSGRRR